MGSHWCGDKLWSPPLPKDLVSLSCTGFGVQQPWKPRSPQASGRTSLRLGWGGKQMISCFLMTPGSVSPPLDRHRRPYTAPWSSGGAGDGARLQRGPWTGFKVQGHTGTGTGSSRAVGSWPGSAAGLDNPQPEAHVLVPAGARVHRASPAPLGVLGGCQDVDGRCPGTGIVAAAHFLVMAWLSPSACCQGSLPRSSLSPFGGSQGWQCHPWLAPV